MLKHSYEWVNQERAGAVALKRKGSRVMIKLYLKRGKSKSKAICLQGMECNKVIQFVSRLLSVCTDFLCVYEHHTCTHVLGVSVPCAGSQLDCVSRQYSSRAVYSQRKFELM